MFNKGCWWGQSYLPIDRMTSSSTGRLFVKYKIVAFLQLRNGLHKDWRCPWKPSGLQGDELTSAFNFHVGFCSGGDHLSILLWRVQPGGGASGKAEVEWGAGKWRDRLWPGRCRTRWCCSCWVQVSLRVSVKSSLSNFFQGFQMRKNAIQGLWEERDCGGDSQASSIQDIKGGAFFLPPDSQNIRNGPNFRGTLFGSTLRRWSCAEAIAPGRAWRSSFGRCSDIILLTPVSRRR